MVNSCIPNGNYVWVEDINELQYLNDNLLSLDPNGDIGYMEIDVFAPYKIHDIVRDYRLFPQNRKMHKGNQTKLIADLYPKSNYIAHYTYIQEAVKLCAMFKKKYKMAMLS